MQLKCTYQIAPNPPGATFSFTLDNAHLVTASGELDVAAAPQLSAILTMGTASSQAVVVLDMGGATFIDSTALGVVIRSADTRRAMHELAERTGSSRSRLSHAVARLEESGWVVRTSCATDRRGAFARLTDAGAKVLEAAAPGHVTGVRRHLFDRLSPDQVRQLGVPPLAVLLVRLPRHVLGGVCERGLHQQPGAAGHRGEGDDHLGPRHHVLPLPIYRNLLVAKSNGNLVVATGARTTPLAGHVWSARCAGSTLSAPPDRKADHTDVRRM